MPSKSDTKMDQILEQLKHLDQLAPMAQKIDELHASLGAFKEELGFLKEEVGCLNFTVQGHGDRLKALKNDMMAQKELSNTQQQQLRLLTLRLLNVPPTKGEHHNNFANLREHVYARFITPLLAAAKDKGEIPVIPPMDSVIDSCFRPYAVEPDKQLPPVIIKLSNKQFKIAIMRNKKELPVPSKLENDAGITRFILVEDLTPDIHRCLAALSKSKLTGKVWSVDGHIKFTKADKPDIVLSVKSVYDSVATILSD